MTFRVRLKAGKYGSLSKAFDQALKSAMNKAIAEAKKEAAKELNKTYGLGYGGGAGVFDKPRISSVLQTTKIKTVGGLKAGVTAKLTSSTDPLGAIKFAPSSEQHPPQKAGLPKNQWQRVRLKVGRRWVTLSQGFIERANNATQAFRRIKDTKSSKHRGEKLAKLAYPSPHSVLAKADVQKRLRDVATKTFEATFVKLFKEKFARAFNGGRL